MIKAGGEILTKLMTKIIQKIIIETRVPKEMKKSTIVLLHKKGSKNDALNYRPITLNNTSNKITDSFIYERILPILREN